VVIASTTVITGISSLLAGIVTVALPTIAKDLQIPNNLLLWYVGLTFPQIHCTTNGSQASINLQLDVRLYATAIRCRCRRRR
jgi:hypothetical protein